MLGLALAATGRSPRSTTRSARPCWWRPRATGPAARSASTACSAISAWRWRRWSRRSWRRGWAGTAAFIAARRCSASPLGLLWLREPAFDTAPRRAGAGPSPSSRRHLVRRAVTVLLLIAAVSGLVFNAFTLLLPEADAGAAGRRRRTAAGGRRCRPSWRRCAARLTQFTVGRLIDRTTLKRVFLPLGAGAGAGPGGAGLRAGLAGAAARRRGRRRRSSAR